MRNAGLEEAKAGIKIARKNISNLRYADDTTLIAASEEELKSLLMKLKKESEKAHSQGWLQGPVTRAGAQELPGKDPALGIQIGRAHV